MTTAAARGERLIGVRLGGPVTRRAPWRIADGDPVLGWLTESMRLPSGQPAPGPLTSPQVVPHLAVVLGDPLTGPGVTPADALTAVASVHAAVELSAGDSAPGGLADGLPAGDSGPAPGRAGGKRGRRAVPGQPGAAGGWARPGPGGMPGRGGRAGGELGYWGGGRGSPGRGAGLGSQHAGRPGAGPGARLAGAHRRADRPRSAAPGNLAGRALHHPGLAVPPRRLSITRRSGWWLVR